MPAARFPSQQPAARRAKYQAEKDEINRRKRERYASDAEYRERKLERGRRNRDAHVERHRASDRARSAASFVNAAKEYIGACVRCGYSRSTVALQWHHYRPDLKEREPSQLRRADDETAIRELRKCVLVCANCHWEVESKIWRVSRQHVVETWRGIEALRILREAARLSLSTHKSTSTGSASTTATHDAVTSMLLPNR